jgi:hypothetical protein
MGQQWVRPQLLVGLRIRVIDFKVTTPSFVVVAPATVQAIVDFGPIDEQRHRPDREQQHNDAQQGPENQNEFSFRVRGFAYFVPLEHLIDKPRETDFS